MAEYKHKRIVVDGNGVEHRVFPALIGEKDKWVELISKINPVNVASNMLALKEDGSVDDEPYNALIEIMKLALKKEDKSRYTKKEIEAFLDVAIAKQVLMHFMGLPVEAVE